MYTDVVLKSVFTHGFLATISGHIIKRHIQIVCWVLTRKLASFWDVFWKEKLSKKKGGGVDPCQGFVVGFDIVW